MLVRGGGCVVRKTKSRADGLNSRGVTTPKKGNLWRSVRAGALCFAFLSRTCLCASVLVIRRWTHELTDACMRVSLLRTPSASRFFLCSPVLLFFSFLFCLRSLGEWRLCLLNLAYTMLHGWKLGRFTCVRKYTKPSERLYTPERFFSSEKRIGASCARSERTNTATENYLRECATIGYSLEFYTHSPTSLFYLSSTNTPE